MSIRVCIRKNADQSYDLVYWYSLGRKKKGAQEFDPERDAKHFNDFQDVITHYQQSDCESIYVWDEAEWKWHIHEMDQIAAYQESK